VPEFLGNIRHWEYQHNELRLKSLFRAIISLEYICNVVEEMVKINVETIIPVRPGLSLLTVVGIELGNSKRNIFSVVLGNYVFLIRSQK
jgi:hypothetical protein